MADDIQSATQIIIKHYQDSIEDMEEEVYEKKKLVNMLAIQAKLPEPYAEIELLDRATKATSSVRKAEFFNKPLTSAIKTYLSRRKDDPATAEEIHAALVAGGYAEFPAKKEDAINGLRISMGKNAVVFAKIPSGDSFLYGLNEWYGINKRAKGTPSAGEPGGAVAITGPDAPGAAAQEEQNA